MSRKFFAPLVVAAAVAAGGVGGALIGVPALSGASETPSSQSAPAATAVPARSGALAAAADALGISVKDLAKDLKDGKTIAQVAQEQERRPEQGDRRDGRQGRRERSGRSQGQGSDHEVRERGRPGSRQGPPACSVTRCAPSWTRRPTRSAWSRVRSRRSSKGGKTIAQVAQEKGVDVNTVIDAMVAPVKERITKFVNEGGPRAAPGRHRQRYQLAVRSDPAGDSNDTKES